MQTETRNCQNCKTLFTIEPEDFLFYQKIQVPPPTFCPECRLQRRYAFRNQMNLYKARCGLCETNIISMYSPDKPFPVYCQSCWWSDGWDALHYGRPYDFSKPFFAQFRELMLRVPRLSLVNRNSVNSEYTNYSSNNKNCYLSFSMGDSEDCYYMGPQITRNKQCISCSMSNDNELCYEAVGCMQCYRVSFSQDCRGCMTSALLLDCRNCQNCIGCINLRSKQYYILNKPHTKEQYADVLAKLDLGSHQNLQAFEKRFAELCERHIHRYATIDNSIDVTGDSIFNSKRCRNCFVALNSEDCKHCFILNAGKDSYDVSNCYPSTEVSYEVVSPVESAHNMFLSVVWANSLYNAYADNCVTVLHTFGCVSLKKKQYCILNKQYTKDEYEALIPKIVEHMNTMPYVDKGGRIYAYGEFFPIELSPFGYNESVAQEYFPLSRDEAEVRGYPWSDAEGQQYAPTRTTEDLPDHIADVTDSLLADVIECAHRKQCLEPCTGAFRILKPELEFYKLLDVPLPRLCVKCRSFDRIKRRNPLKLWHRACQCTGTASQNGIYKNSATHRHGATVCQEEFETSYSPERSEIVYCESCYNSEVA